MDHVDPVEPTEKQSVHVSMSQDISFYFCRGMCFHMQPHPKFIRRVYRGRPGGMVSRDRKVQWTSLVW